MRIVVAPDSYKGSVSAPGVAATIQRGITQIFPDAVIDLVPIADGGEGTVEALMTATHDELHHARVTNPLGKPLTAH